MTIVPLDAPREDAVSFAALGVPTRVVAALERTGVAAAFPIQVATMHDAVAGRDLIARGRTGSGKTLAFAVPTIVRLLSSSQELRIRRPRALVLVPTRELATQVAATFTPLARAVGLQVATVHGGASAAPQGRALTRGVDILVACPGRLEDLLRTHVCRLDDVEITVLDEADHLADLGFLPSVRRLLDLVPAGGQRLLFSATIDHAVDTIVQAYLHDPVVHAIDAITEQVPSMDHHLLHVRPNDKRAVVHALARGTHRTLLFTRTKRNAEKLTAQLVAEGIPAVELHGNLTQSTRAGNLRAFAEGRANVLVATDIAARGIHVDDIGLVVHVDPPAEHKAYLHRSGRTARAGARGTVVTVALPDQRHEVTALARGAGVRYRATDVTPSHPILESICGAAADDSPDPRGSAPIRR